MKMSLFYCLLKNLLLLPGTFKVFHILTTDCFFEKYTQVAQNIINDFYLKNKKDMTKFGKKKLFCCWFPTPQELPATRLKNSLHFSL